MSQGFNSGNITDAHLQVYREMIEEALTKAAMSMGQMLRIRMKYDLIDFGHGLLDSIDEFDLLGRFKANVVKVAFSEEIKWSLLFYH